MPPVYKKDVIVLGRDFRALTTARVCLDRFLRRNVLSHIIMDAAKPQLYQRIRTAAKLKLFKAFPHLASALREFRQEAHKTHHTSFGLDLVGPRYLFDSGFEADEVALVQKKLQQIEALVDVGANVGVYTCLAARQGRRVVAIEPLPSNLHYLYQNLIRNGLEGVEVFPVGLSSTPGLSVLAGTGAQASFVADWAQEDFGFNKYIENLCPVSTLDIILGSRFVGQRLLIKIDVEGFEFEVLQGASATLDMSPRPTWILECFLERFHPGSKNPKFLDTFDIFFDRGYRASIASLAGATVSRDTVNQWVERGIVEGSACNFVFEHPADF